MIPPLLGAVREAALDALALVLPTTCAGCGRADRALCERCRERLAPMLVETSAQAGLPVFAGAPYRDTVQRVVLAFKEGRTPLAGALAPLLAAAIARAAPLPGVELCVVPSTRGARRRRGFDPTMLVLTRTGWRPARVLHPARAHRVQKGLGRAARRDNLRGVHRARGRLDRRRFLLVDDVVTTGATLAEVARAIRSAGGEVVGAAVIAATPRLGRAERAPSSPSAKRR